MEENWKELAEQKEKEWRQFTHLRIESLEVTLKEKEKVVNEEKAKFQKLKEDFKYNLKLLQERDQELERYDAVFSELKAQVNSKNSEISEAKILLDEMRTRLKQEERGREELQLHYQQRLKEKQGEIEAFRCTKESKLNEERKEFEEFKRNLQQKLTEVEGELDAQKRELSAGFDEAMRKREHEIRLKHDEMSAKNLEYELKAKILLKELEFVKTSQKQVTSDYSQSENYTRQLEKQMKEKEWEITDNKAMADAMINELEAQIKQMEININRSEEDYQRKHADMDKCLREREEALSKVKDSYLEREQLLTNSIRELQTKLETADIELRQLQWTNQDLSKEKDIQTHKLKEELQELQDKWDKSVADMSRSQVARDLEVHCLRESDSKLKAEILQKKQDIERYKKELTLAAEREATLERSKAQLELDWQNRYEDTERVQYEKSEDFIRKLISARDEALGTIKEKTRGFEEQETLLRTVQRDRDIVMATLKKHGIPLDKNLVAQMEVSSAEEIKQIQQQNRNLKDVVTQMRQQMELLGHSNIPLSGSHNNTNDDNYIHGLIEQIQSLKQQVRQLENQHTDSPDIEKHTEILSEVKDNVIIRDHIQSLNENIGILRSEKTEVNAQCRKLQARLYYFETSSDKLSKEPRQKQIEIDQLKYELSTSKRRYEAETASLNQRISDLELQLIETRKEADEYYRGSLERNMEVTVLGNKLSSLKMKMAESRPVFNLGAQELVIQQLQDEIMRLKQRGDDTLSENRLLLDNLNLTDGNTTVHDLHNKLKKAVKHITQLAKDKQQLIEVGNRLHGELKKAGITPAPPASSQQFTSARNVILSATNIIPSASQVTNTYINHDQQQQLSQEFINKLNQLEKLQYQLTKQELQFAQRFSPPKVRVLEQSLDKTERPASILKKSTPDVSRSRDFISPGNSSHIDPVLMSMSSVGGESIQEVWNMLDDRASHSTITPRVTSHKGQGDSKAKVDNFQQWSVEGRKTELKSKDIKPMHSSITRTNKLKVNSKAQVRNYNRRHDTSNK